VEEIFLLPEKELPRPVRHDVLFKGR